MAHDAVQCGADKSFDALSCGWGWGCSNGAAKGQDMILPGIKASVQCTDSSTAQTDGDMSVCGSDGYTKYRVFVRSDD